MRKIQVFAFIATIFLFTHLLGIYLAREYIELGYKQEISPNPYHSAGIFLVMVAIATATLLLVIKYLGWKPMKIFFSFTLFIGILPVFDLFLHPLFTLTITIGLLALRFLRPSIVSHNLTIVLSMAGVSVLLALTLNVLTVAIILIVLSVYDVIAVFKTKHMIKLAKDMMKGGVPLSVVVPESLKKKEAKEKDEKGYKVSQLGTGDVALPLVFAITVLAEYGLLNALIISLSSLVGLTVSFLWVSKLKKPIPALPPISICSLIGFGISLII